MSLLRNPLVGALSCLALTAALFAGRTPGIPKTLVLWPNGAPGEHGHYGPERNMTKPTDGLVAGKTVIRLGDVTKPTITLYRPPANRNTGTAVLVCPGGAYNILAMDLEGTEVCHWLNSLGVTGVLLKYRVPRRPGQPPYAAPLQDAQRALGIVRDHARDWGINPHRIGVIGFSAGGNLAAVLSTNYRKRTYPMVDKADKVSCRPDFAMLIYPAYLVVHGQVNHLAPELDVTAHTPPTFMVMAEDDPVGVQNVLGYFLALKRAKVPAELHVYAHGGHGYGLRRTNQMITTWPARAADWLRHGGWLKPQEKTNRRGKTGRS